MKPQRRRRAFSEDLSPAQHCVAAEAPGDKHKLHASSDQRQVGHVAPVMAVNASRCRSA